jgi:hypothetical protein
MSEDLKELLRKNLEISERTLQLVEKMHRAALWARFFSLVKWSIIIAATVWGYLIIQPYIQQFLGISQQVGDLQKSIPTGGMDALKGFLGGSK